ncbi:MAG: Na(+)-translocating NADH-quinone reductase subunit C [Verrucomicrobiota bacterium]|nr:Na(+)-translocating NADH-quinone reductase subunit C [Verrucomicrobiota bacterium]MDD8051036.1 Na(+)-translocating NADH-quinone reductase subunit C [Verrucomicrobiota bacterium]HCF93968.1 Na(+)-translocating NADH-quinone reductase subunit C [Verrucomicrobiota bacterium]
MQPRNSTRDTIAVGLGVCVICSLLVSTAAVYLKPKQEANKRLDIQKNILVAAGLLESGASIDPAKVEELFARIETKVLDLTTGQFTDEYTPAEFDADAIESDPATSIRLTAEQDLAAIRRRANFRLVYMLHEGPELKRLILPLHGKGLWSTMYGFLALEGDLNTIASLAFYQHGETPGLGGEIDNPLWKAHWAGKQVFEPGEWEEPKIEVIKGSVDPESANAEYQVDGLSGATLTSRGVTHTLEFWLGQDGYGPFLETLRGGEQNG